MSNVSLNTAWTTYAFVVAFILFQVGSISHIVPYMLHGSGQSKPALCVYLLRPDLQFSEQLLAGTHHGSTCSWQDAGVKTDSDPEFRWKTCRGKVRACTQRARTYSCTLISEVFERWPIGTGVVDVDTAAGNWGRRAFGSSRTPGLHSSTRCEFRL